MRESEQKLFGAVAGVAGKSQKSALRLRLDRWDLGKLKNWGNLDSNRVTHPEVSSPVGSQLYLGYGPLGYQAGKTSLKANAAIQAGEYATLRLAVPEDHLQKVSTALWLIDRYGTAGGRSRNGWGSISLSPGGDAPFPPDNLDATLVRDWRTALAHDWPHCVGANDNGPLIWQTEPMPDWSTAMLVLAKIKIALRTQFLFKMDASMNDHASDRRGITHGGPQSRHWLSYPVTNHPVRDWQAGNYRLPNSLRFKVRVDGDDRFRGIIFHVPSLPPRQFKPAHEVIERTWLQVHALLDALCLRPERRDYEVDGERLNRLQPMLDSISLARVDT